MPNHTGLSPDSPNKYLGPNVYLTSVVTRNREPTGADYRQPETGKLYPFNTFWLIGKNPTTGTQGDLWYLSKIVANVAFWIKISTGSVGPLINIQVQAATPPGVNPVTPTVGGLITFNGAAVANHSVPVETRSRALNTMNLEVQYGAANPTTDATKSGLLHAFASQFTVDANGFLQLIGGVNPAIQGVEVDASTPPGTDPVLANASGLITVTGAQVATGVVGTNVIRTNSLAANTYTIEIQRTTSAVSTNVALNGVSHFHNADFIVDANAFVSLNPVAVTQQATNLGISYNAGTGVFTVNGYDGTALSASNPAVVFTQDRNTPGLLRRYLITANQSFIDDNGASQIIGNLFGTTTGVAVVDDLPFFLYGATNDTMTTLIFGTSRIPHMTVAPVVANIGTPASAVADTQGSIFLFSSVTVADYDANPVVNLGSFRMRKTTADDWTVQTLTTQDGIGRFQENRQFTFPRGQYGAAANKVFANNGGTAPDDATGSAYGYYVQRDGFCQGKIAYPSTDTAGLGAVNASLVLPYAADGSIVYKGVFTNNGTTFALVHGATGANNSSLCNVLYQTSDVGNGILQNASFTVPSLWAGDMYFQISLL